MIEARSSPKALASSTAETMAVIEPRASAGGAENEQTWRCPLRATVLKVLESAIGL